MKAISLYPFWCFLISVTGFGQATLADVPRDTSIQHIEQGFSSLPRELATELKKLAQDSDGTDQVDQLINWSYEPEYRDIQTLLAQTALRIAKQKEYPKGIGDSEVKLGNIARKQGEYDLAIEHYLRGIRVRREIGDAEGVAGVYNNLGLIEKLRGRFIEAAGYYREGLDVFTDESPNERQAMLYNNLGTSLRYQGEYDEALTAFRKSLEIAQLLGLMDRQASARLNMAVLLQDDLHLYTEARDSLLKCLADFEAAGQMSYVGKCLLGMGNNQYYQKQYPQAVAYYKQALAPEYGLSVHDQAITRKNLGSTYFHMGANNKALSYLQRALQDLSALDSRQEIAATHFQLGEVYLAKEQSDLAVQHLEKALAFDKIEPELQNQIRLMLASTLHEQGRYQEASPHWALYFPYHDSISTSYQDAIATLKRAEAKNMQLEIQLQQQQTEQVKAESQTYRTFSYVGFGVLWLLLGLALMAFYLSRQKRRLAEQQEKLAQQQVIELLQENELKANYAWLEGQEETRQRIGRELHDSLGAMLATIKMHFSSVEDRLGKLEVDNRKQYQKANDLLDMACEEVRRISHEMMSAILVKFGLKAQLEALAETIAGSGKLQVELSTHGLRERLPTKLEFNIYRILQELVSNVIRHAKADTLSIQVNRFDDLINIMVEDDGIGFDKEKVTAQGGMGMQNLAARIHDLDGQLNIDSRPNKGTHVSIDLPINQFSVKDTTP